MESATSTDANECKRNNYMAELNVSIVYTYK